MDLNRKGQNFLIRRRKRRWEGIRWEGGRGEEEEGKKRKHHYILGV